MDIKTEFMTAVPSVTIEKMGVFIKCITPKAFYSIGLTDHHYSTGPSFIRMELDQREDEPSLRVMNEDEIHALMSHPLMRISKILMPEIDEDQMMRSYLAAKENDFISMQDFREIQPLPEAFAMGMIKDGHFYVAKLAKKFFPGPERPVNEFFYDGKKMPGHRFMELYHQAQKTFDPCIQKQFCLDDFLDAFIDYGRQHISSKQNAKHTGGPEKEPYTR